MLKDKSCESYMHNNVTYKYFNTNLFGFKIKKKSKLKGINQIFAY